MNNKNNSSSPLISIAIIILLVIGVLMIIKDQNIISDDSFKPFNNIENNKETDIDKTNNQDNTSPSSEISQNNNELSNNESNEGNLEIKEQNVNNNNSNNSNNPETNTENTTNNENNNSTINQNNNENNDNNSNTDSNTNNQSNNTNNNNENNNTSNQNNNTNNNNNSNTNIAVTKVTLNYTSYNLYPSQSITLNTSISPSNATNQSITWTSSNNNIATVSNGKVTAKAVGTATITAKSSNGKVATCTIKVQNVNKIHYVSNGSNFITPTNGSKGASPANTIVLESNGHFALIDAGLKNSNSLNPGHATLVINYLKKIGAKKLDFIIITHDHYDHMGGLSEILDAIQTDIVYIKPYYSHDGDGTGDETVRTLYAGLLSKYFGSSFSCNSSCISNPDTYRSALKAIDSLYGTKRTNVGKLKMTSILYKINANAEGKQLTLGNMNLTMYNTTNLSYHSECYGTSSSEFDENSNSIVTYIKMGNRKALIGGDLEPVNKTCYTKIYGSCSSSKCSIMNNVVNKISSSKLNVDLLELSHHGYSSCDMSTSLRDKINPYTIVIPNWKEKIQYYYSSNGPYPNSSSCKYKYFNTSYYNSNSFFVGSNNLVFDYTNNEFNIYNN